MSTEEIFNSLWFNTAYASGIFLLLLFMNRYLKMKNFEGWKIIIVLIAILSFISSVTAYANDTQDENSVLLGSVLSLIFLILISNALSGIPFLNRFQQFIALVTNNYEEYQATLARSNKLKSAREDIQESKSKGLVIKDVALLLILIVINACLLLLINQ